MVNPPRLQERLVVRFQEADSLGRLRMSGILDLFQDIAGRHADLLLVGTTALHERGQAWVLVRLRVEAARMPRAGETLDLLTWPRGLDRLFARRDFRLTEPGGALVAAASSAWLLVDRASLRPLRIDRIQPELADFPPQGALARDPVKLKPAAAAVHLEERRVRYGDVDINNHVNNARYVAWLEDADGDRLSAGDFLRTVEINYLGEARLGEVIRLARSQTAPSCETWEMTRASSGERVLLAAVEWNGC